MHISFQAVVRRRNVNNTMIMTMLRTLCLPLILPGLMWAQAIPEKPDAPPDNLEVAAELKALRSALLQAEKELAAQRREIEALKHQSKAEEEARFWSRQPAAIKPAALTSISSNVQPADISAAVNAASQSVVQEKAKETESKLSSFKLGNAVLTLGGFVDLENVFRTTNTQNNIVTNYAAIPFSNTPQGHLSEFRTTAQYSRLNIKVADKFGGNDVIGYIEGDFSGNDAASVYQTTNSHTNRLRLYFMELKRGKWEFLGGQTWSWLTPNRHGLGPMPSDLAITFNEDQNIGVGLPYTRAAEFRIAYHPNEHWAIGVGIENPNQFIGGFVALPSAFASALSTQFDNGNQIGAANPFPDILSKATYDGDIMGRHFHAEVTGLFTGAHSSVMPIGERSFKSHTVVGGGGQIGANYELLRKFLFLANAFWSDGGAHYLVNTGPQVVIRPNSAGTDITPSMVHSGAGSVGFEWNASQKTAFAVYYGADYFQRNFFLDTTNVSHPGTIIGYGGPGSPNTNNRTIQEATLDWLQTFWKHPKYGALQFYTQYSYLTRAPWFVTPDTPKNAHVSMIYAGFRYILPSTSGTLQQVPYPN